MNGKFQYGSARTVTSRATRALTQFRAAIAALGEHPTRGELENALKLAHSLGLRQDEIAAELTQIHAALRAIDLRDHLTAGRLPVVDCRQPLPPHEMCHYTAPARFGRRKSDHFGHLLLTSAALMFRGSLDVRLPWAEVAAVRRDGCDLMITVRANVHEGYRFCCQTMDEAVSAGVLADYLTQNAHALEGSSYQQALL